MKLSRINPFAVLLIALLLLSGCASKALVADGVNPLIPDAELVGSELLDVAIVVFDSKELTDEEIQKQGLSREIRQAEERFVPIHLKYTMQRTGYWGAVRVVPTENSAHLLVRGTIEHSDGESMILRIKAADSRGVIWLEKTYSEKLRLAEYSHNVPGEKDSFQDIYNTIANDLAIARLELAADDSQEIHHVAELRFAEDLAPEAFAGYLTKDEEGRFHLQRLPVENDPMLERVRAAQVRDDMLIDTINGYYELYYNDLWQPYEDWRKLHGEEISALKEVKKQALTRKLLGAASIVGAVLLSAGDSDLASSNLPEVMIMGGAAAIYSGFQKSEETKIHKEAIEELSLSFAAEAEPLVVEVLGETVRLTGSAEQQYQRWREMLGAIYLAETGLPPEADINNPEEMVPVPESARLEQ